MSSSTFKDIHKLKYILQDLHSIQQECNQDQNTVCNVNTEVNNQDKLQEQINLFIEQKKEFKYSFKNPIFIEKNYNSNNRLKRLKTYQIMKNNNLYRNFLINQLFFQKMKLRCKNDVR